MLPYFTHKYGNPSTIYQLPDVSKDGVDQARRQLANVLNCRPREVIFTSGGTEADNAALKGTVGILDRSHPIKSIVVSAVEHDAVRRTAESLGQSFAEVRIKVVPVDEHGLVDPEQVARRVDKDTVLVSVMYVNNEVGTIQNKYSKFIQILGSIFNKKTLFHKF